MMEPEVMLLAGDGIYSATIPGQASGTMVAFYMQATDRFPVPADQQVPETRRRANAWRALAKFSPPEISPFIGCG